MLVMDELTSDLQSISSGAIDLGIRISALIIFSLLLFKNKPSPTNRTA